MSPLLTYLNSLPPPEQAAYAARCKTTVGYLRKAISADQRISAETCIRLERESGGVVLCEALRPDVDWTYIRGSVVSRVDDAGAHSDAPAQQAELFTQSGKDGAAAHCATLAAARSAVHHNARGEL